MSKMAFREDGTCTEYGDTTMHGGRTHQMQTCVGNESSSLIRVVGKDVS